MSDQKDQAEPGFALVRNKKTGNAYVTKWRDEDIEVIRPLDVDAYGQPEAVSEAEVAEHSKKPAAAPKKEI